MSQQEVPLSQRSLTERQKEYPMSRRLSDRKLLGGRAELISTDSSNPDSHRVFDTGLLEDGMAQIYATPEQVDAARIEMYEELVPRLQKTVQRLGRIVNSHWEAFGIPEDERNRQLRDLGAVLSDDKAATAITEQQDTRMGKP